MLHDPRVRVVSFTGSTEVGRKLLHERRRQRAQARDGTRRQRAVHRVRGRRHRRRDRRRDDRQDAQHGRGLHRGQPLLCAREGARRVRQEAHRQDGGAEDGQRPRRRRGARAAGQRRRPRQGDRAGRRRGAARAPRCSTGGKRRTAPGFFYPATVLDQRARQRQDAERGNLRAGRRRCRPSRPRPR